MVSAVQLSHSGTQEIRAIPRISLATVCGDRKGAPSRAEKFRLKLPRSDERRETTRFRTMNPLSKAQKTRPSAMPRTARRPVLSSMMRSAGYDGSHAVLEIEFVSGEVYRYHAVPRREWQGLMDADSKGRYFDAHIRDKYPMRRTTNV